MIKTGESPGGTREQGPGDDEKAPLSLQAQRV